MNNKEYWSQADAKRTPNYKMIHVKLKEWKLENNITERCMVHHRDDTEETRKYNSEHYERWGLNEDGTFEYGKYVVFITLSEHSAYHNTGERNPMYGKHHSEEACTKISAAHKGKKPSEETRTKISAAQKGKKLSEETRARMSANHSHYWKGKTRSEETCAKLSAAHKGKERSEETRAKISAVQTGTRVLYTTYKENGGTLKWNDFCHALKNGEITFEMQPITIYTSE